MSDKVNKDNLTDVVEIISGQGDNSTPSHSDSQDNSSSQENSNNQVSTDNNGQNNSSPQEVTGPNGEPITLGM